MTVTAKVRVSQKVSENGGTRITFYPDYADGRNKEWAVATPNLFVDMTVNGDVESQFEPGDVFTLVLEKEE